MERYRDEREEGVCAEEGYKRGGGDGDGQVGTRRRVGGQVAVGTGGHEPPGGQSPSCRLAAALCAELDRRRGRCARPTGVGVGVV